MGRVPLVLGSLLLIVASCGDDAVVDTTAAPVSFSSSTTTVAPTVTTTTTTTTTTTEAVTRTSFTAPPPTVPNPERADYVGIWSWSGNPDRYMLLFEHGVIVTQVLWDGDDNFDSERSGQWDVHDGVMTITSQRGLGGMYFCDGYPGTYEISIWNPNLVMTLIEDGCQERSLLLLGRNRTSRTWLPATMPLP
jgi:hypothetical protein